MRIGSDVCISQEAYLYHGQPRPEGIQPSLSSLAEITVEDGVWITAFQQDWARHDGAGRPRCPSRLWSASPQSDMTAHEKIASAMGRTPSASAADARVLALEAGRAERNYWDYLWHYRELFAILAWRDIAAATSRR